MHSVGPEAMRYESINCTSIRFSLGFQTRQFLFLPSINFLTFLDCKQYSQQQGPFLDLSLEDLNRFCTMQKANEQLQAAFNRSRKRGGNSESELEDD